MRTKLFLLINLLLINFNPFYAQEKVLRIGAIPDQNQEILNRRFNLLSKQLSKELKVKVKYVPVINYVAAVTSFKNKDLDLVWFGGLSGVQARLQTPNSKVIAQRDVDKRFKSVFIVNKKLKIDYTNQINDLRKLKGTRFTFGSENSTSGRLMPQYFLNKVGIDITDFKGRTTGFSGSHDATIALVNSGSYDSGALNIQIYEKTIINNPQRTKNIDVFFITPEYPDYHWVSQGNLDNKFRKGFTEELESFFLNLKIDNLEHEQILKLFNAEKFIDVDIQQYKKIESIGRKLKKIR
tara:strand:+ start:4892 stop:5776 length:885 start_codon:yes stop_codon:yes gene_type:complete